MIIKIDNREGRRGHSAEKYYHKKGHNTTIQKLPIGDYIFNNEVIFEFKTIPDFINSVQTGRVFKQAIRQYENYKHHFIIIKGTYNELQNIINQRYYLKKGQFTIKQYYGAIARLNTYTTVIQAPNQKKAFQLMETQANKCLENKTPHTKQAYKEKEAPAYRVLCYCIDNISSKRAKLITEELGLKSIQDITTIQYDDLIQVKGIGEKTAKEIIGAIYD